MTGKTIKSRPGLFGVVYYYDEQGRSVGKSRPGLIEGTRVYCNRNGGYAGKSRPGFLASQVFTGADHSYITSYDHFSGQTHFCNGVPVGHTRPGCFDTAYTTVEADSYEEYNPQTTISSVVKKLWFIAACLAVVAVSLMVYVFS